MNATDRRRHKFRRNFYETYSKKSTAELFLPLLVAKATSRQDKQDFPAYLFPQHLFEGRRSMRPARAKATTSGGDIK